ncbi:MAG: hypothetical protein ACFFD4_12530 [Candidatus Odinarchaeota archaeon]
MNCNHEQVKEKPTAKIEDKCKNGRRSGVRYCRNPVLAPTNHSRRHYINLTFASSI